MHRDNLVTVISSHNRTRFAVLTVAAAILVSGLAASPAQAITKSQVEAACADSQEAYDTYQAARSDFLDATDALDDANRSLEIAEAKEQRIRGQFEANESAQLELKPRVEATAVDLYMQSVGTGTAGLVALDKPEDALVAYEFMASSTQGNLAAMSDLSALTSELDRLGGDLDEVVEEKTDLRDDQQALTADQERAMGAALDSYDKLTDRCKELQADYEAEQARLRAEEEARKQREAEARRRAASGRSSGGSGDGSSSTRVVSGMICPFQPGRTQFTNSFGAPRSGGRRHRGTDMFAPFDEPILAVESGSVSVSNHGLGGKQIFLNASSGRSYYYAHLNGFNVANGASVNQGDVIGFNGNTGNAAGGSPHLHFQIYPTGYRGGVINPYYSVAAVCF